MMKKIIFSSSILLVLILSIIFNTNILDKKKSSIPRYPNDYFYYQRAFPYKDINYKAYRKALSQADELKKRANKTAEAWQFAGPTNIGGRITDVEMSPVNRDTIYAGAASGGIFRSVDRGISWTAIFDDALSLSIGDIAIDPNKSDVVYVGTGENNGGGGSTSYSGMGLYKSTNAGQSWIHLGMEETHYTGRIVVDPNNSDRVYFGAMGRLYAKNEERGLYRSDN